MELTGKHTLHCPNHNLSSCFLVLDDKDILSPEIKVHKTAVSLIFEFVLNLLKYQGPLCIVCYDTHQPNLSGCAFASY